MEEGYTTYISFSEIFNALEVLVNEGDEKLKKAFDHTQNLIVAATNAFDRASDQNEEEGLSNEENEEEFNKQTQELYQIQEKIGQRRDFIKFTGDTLQQQIKFLAFHCGDTSIASDRATMGKPADRLVQATTTVPPQIQE